MSSECQVTLNEWSLCSRSIRDRVELLGCASLVRLESRLLLGSVQSDLDDAWWERHLVEWTRGYLRKWWGEPWAIEPETIETLNDIDILFRERGREFGDELSRQYAVLIQVWWPDPAWFSRVLSQGYRWSATDGRMRKIPATSDAAVRATSSRSE